MLAAILSARRTCDAVVIHQILAWYSSLPFTLCTLESMKCKQLLPHWVLCHSALLVSAFFLPLLLPSICISYLFVSPTNWDSSFQHSCAIFPDKWSELPFAAPELPGLQRMYRGRECCSEQQWQGWAALGSWLAVEERALIEQNSISWDCRQLWHTAPEMSCTHRGVLFP